MDSLATEEEKDGFLKTQFENKGVLIGLTDQTKVTMFVNLTFNERVKKETENELAMLKGLCQKFGEKDLTVFGQYTFDVVQTEKLSNNLIAKQLNKAGLVDEKGLFSVPNFKFLEKVDVNGVEMHELYKFLKRNSPNLFVARYGMAQHIYDYHLKVLCNRYGEVKKQYGANTDFAIIENDIRQLIKEDFRL
mmetsp:Transcript_7054/g.11872  ORF Transcript_7054/g.11872 Transcript_7054/m.11872 type:complete len:191 (-) Transcript_7054:74-646(-)